jgi:bacteriocin biosynthesis cyclodehydratase domain-containing protein
MVLRLDPRLPVVWRSPDSVQIGYDRAVARLDRLTAHDEYLLAALKRGVTRAGLDLVVQSVGGDAGEADAFLARIAPALGSGSPPSPSLRGQAVAVAGKGAAADRICRFLAELGARSVAFADEPDESVRVDLAVLVSTFAISPAASGYWLRRDVPHLAVVFGDSQVRVGPLVDPGSGPCLHCVDRARLDDDPAWAAMASQLVGQPAATESPLPIAECLPLVARAVRDRLGKSATAARRNTLSRTVSVLDRDSGRLSELAVSPHPDCACQALPLPGSETAT